MQELPQEAPPPGATSEVAPGVLWLRMPLPFALDHVNLWLIREGDGFALVDCGYGDAVTRAYWATQFEEMRMQPPPSAPIPLWVGGSSDKALERAVKLCDGWHGSRLTAEAAAPVIKRLRTLRPDKTFTISLRTSFDGKDPAELGARLGAYRDAGADHIMVQPEDRDIDDWMRTVEKIARAGSAH